MGKDRVGEVMSVENDEQFRAWLEEQSPSTCVAVAARAALRVLPLICSIDPGNSKQANLTLASFRSVHTASVAAAISRSKPEEDIFRAASREAYQRANDANISSADDDVALEAARIAAYSSFAATSPDRGDSDPSVAALETAQSAFALAANMGVAGLRQSIFADADIPPGPNSVLTSPVSLPPELQEYISRVRRSNNRIWVLTAGGDWEFWGRWYSRAMAGDPLPWDLQREVALIPDEIWEQGPEAVAEEIEKIEAAYLARTKQLYEDVAFDPQNVTFSSAPRPLENPPLIAALISRTEDALQDALDGKNGLRDDMRAVRTLRRCHQLYSNDPQRIELDYTSIAISLRRKILYSQEVAETENNLSLLEAVEEGALAIRAQHPEIAESRRRITTQKLREIEEADQEDIGAAEPVSVALGENAQAMDFTRDIPQLIDGTHTFWPSRASTSPGVGSFNRLLCRASRLRSTVNSIAAVAPPLFHSAERSLFGRNRSRNVLTYSTTIILYTAAVFTLFSATETAFDLANAIRSLLK